MPDAVHRAIVCVDVERFGDRARTNPHQVAVRDGLYRALRAAFADAQITWQDCYHEDRGDGLFVLVPPEVPKNVLVSHLPRKLAAELAAHNQVHDQAARIRLRLAVHAGEIQHDENGVAGSAINFAYRLLDAEPLKRALAGSAGMLAVIASQWFYEEVIRHDAVANPAAYRQIPVSVKETQASAWICVPDDPYPPRPDGMPPRVPNVAVPRQLPAAVAGFAGREAELEALSTLLEDITPDGGSVVISAVHGTAGIGKTALAVHWAHQVARRFPDGQLYVNLRGFDPAVPPMTSGEAIRGFLDAFEVPVERIPVSLDAQAALYRSLLAGRRALVVLDNARDIDQIRPLLPGSPGSMVVVTSRNQLTGLIAEGARPLTLDLLPVADARRLLAGRLGQSRVAAQPQAAEEIIIRCARLPLALAIVAARATSHPTFPLTALADELRDARQRLAALNSGEATTDTRAVFSWSYQQLTDDAARLFRLLGLHPGPDVSVPAAAGLADIPVERARSLMAELARTHLIAEHTPGRFIFHDLLRVYATEQAHAHETAAERQAALRRVLDHYLHTAHSGALLLYPGGPPISVIPPEPGVRPQELEDYPAASAWFEAEYPVLLAVIEQAIAMDCSTHAWQLAWTLTGYFRQRGHWHDWIATFHTTLTGAQRLNDQRGQAHTHAGLGRVCAYLGRYQDAHTHLRQALQLFEDLADQAGQADAHYRLGQLFVFWHRYEEALAHAEQALALSSAAGYRRGQATALNDIGWFHILLGNPEQTLTYGQQALAIHRELGDSRSEGFTLDTVGYAHHHLGHHQQAAAYFEQALLILRKGPDRFDQAAILDHLGDTHHVAGDLTAARGAWHQAVEILDRLGIIPRLGSGYPDPDAIRAKLRGLDQENG
jgi:tetratricopeptide (TPR) repeat protein